MQEFNKSISEESSEKDFEAQKAEFLRLMNEATSDKDEDYGPWGRDDPSLQKLREAGYDIERLKKVFEN